MAPLGKTTDPNLLVQRVGARLDMPIDSTSSPSTSQVLGWLNDGALLLAQVLPETVLGSMMGGVGYDSVGSVLALDTSPGDAIAKVVYVKKFGVICDLIPLSELELRESRMPLLHSSRNPACAATGVAGALSLRFLPTSEGPVTVHGVMRPEMYVATGYTVQPYSPPAEWERLLVEYAIVQAKAQDEELEQWKLLRDGFYQEIAIIGQNEVVGSEGVQT